MPFRAKSSTAAKRASLRCKLGNERSERSSHRKHSEIFQNSTFGLYNKYLYETAPTLTALIELVRLARIHAI